MATTPTPAQKAFLAAFAALVALGVSLGFVFTNGSPSLPEPAPTPPTSTPTVVPSPSPTPTSKPPVVVPVVKSTSFRVAVWNEKSFPSMSAAKYAHDLVTGATTGWAKSPALAYLGSEFTTATELADVRTFVAAHPGWAVRGLGSDTMQAFSPRSGFTLFTTHRVQFVPKPPGPASPARSYVATWSEVNGFRVMFLSLHLPNGCFARNSHASWYKGRCASLAKSIVDARAVVAHEVANNWTVVVGGDLNKHSTPIIWGARQRFITPRADMQLAVVPAADVTPDLSAVKVVKANSAAGLYTDHPLVSAQFTLTRR